MRTIGLLAGYEGHSPVQRVLRTICSDADYRLETLANFHQLQSFTHAVWGLINMSDVLVADLTQLSNNLCYEIGLAHGLGKPVVLVADSTKGVPADLLGEHILTLGIDKYSDDNTAFRLRTAISDALKERNAPGFAGPRTDLSRNLPQDGISTLSTNFRSLFAYDGFARTRKFEEWIKQAFSGIPGLDVIAPDKGPRGDRQFDLMLWSSMDDPELTALGNPTAVELKSVQSFNSSQLSLLLHSARKSGLRSLILATTGSNSKRVRQRLARLRQEEGINVVELDRDDLAAVETPSDMLRVLKRKIREMLYNQDY